ncbi:MAG TPA: hypothetical protein VFZ36_07375 [Vicinamibacterales bacterium]
MDDRTALQSRYPLHPQSALESRSTLQSLNDRQLVNALTTITMFERGAIAKVVVGIAEFDRRRLFLPLGYTSLFAYCTLRLGFSQDEAFHRIEAARVSRRVPLILDYLEKGAINLTTVRLLGPHLNGDNHKRLLDAASYQKRPEVDMLIARLRPKPDVPSTIRKLPDIAARQLAPAPAMSTNAPENPASPVPRAVPDGTQPLVPGGFPGSPGNGAGAETRPTGGAADSAVVPGAARQIPARRAIVAPLSESSYRLQITLSKASHDTLREIQALIRHVIPNGDPAAIVARSLNLLLEELHRRKTAQVKRPRAGKSASPRGRHIPAHVRRKVWERDGGRCAFVSAEGVRCDADGFVEYHHVTPYARGGKATAGNIELRCRAHNAHEAELVYGRAGPR